MKIQCPRKECKYEWETKSALNFVTCPNCQKKFSKGTDELVNEYNRKRKKFTDKLKKELEEQLSKKEQLKKVS